MGCEKKHSAKRMAQRVKSRGHGAEGKRSASLEERPARRDLRSATLEGKTDG